MGGEVSAWARTLRGGPDVGGGPFTVQARSLARAAPTPTHLPPVDLRAVCLVRAMVSVERTVVSSLEGRALDWAR